MSSFFHKLVHKPSRKGVLLAAGASALVIVGIVAGGLVLFSGTYSTAATTQHFRITHRLLDAGLKYSVRTGSSRIVAPPLDDPAMIRRGVACYSRHCVQCHGAPGVPSGHEGKGLLPVPSALAQSAREWPAAWLYYVTSRGVRMTGMPAWRYRMSEDSLWSTVAFLKQLPFMTVGEYQRLASNVPEEACTVSTEPTGPYSAERAKVMLRQYACHSCHRIQGVVGPESYAGPALVEWSQRKYIAGVLPNTYENLVHWIRDPQSVSPGTMMPDLEVAEAHARVMATYLMELE